MKVRAGQKRELSVEQIRGKYELTEGGGKMDVAFRSRGTRLKHLPFEAQTLGMEAERTFGNA